MTAITLPQRKPEWLRQQIATLEQRLDMARDLTAALLTTKATQGLDTSATVLRALDQTKQDLADIHEQLSVLNTGWDTLHPKPASGGPNPASGGAKP